MTDLMNSHQDAPEIALEQEIEPAEELKLDSIIIEETDLNEIYAGPRQDVTH